MSDILVPEPSPLNPDAGVGLAAPSAFEAFARELCRFANLNPDDVISDAGHTTLDWVITHDVPRLLRTLLKAGER